MHQPTQTTTGATSAPVCVLQPAVCKVTRTFNNKRIRKRKTVNYPPTRPRSKPHPKDNQFKVAEAAVLRPVDGLPTINRLRGLREVVVVPCTTIVIALAMSWDCARDRLRLQMMQLNTPGTRVITASTCKYTKGRLPHIDCDFSVDRGLRKVTARIRAEQSASPQARVVVILDHYWCEIRYYERQYGLNWLREDAHTLLSNGAEEVLLPFDNGANIPYEASGMIQMLTGPIHPDVTVDLVAGEQNPLWVASSSPDISEILGDIPGGDNAEQCRLRLDEDHPFVRCTHKKVVAKVTRE
jgi:hypothetical protein